MTDAPAIAPELDPATDEASWRETRRTSPVELLWDLVFVFAVTQVTTLLSGKLTWAGFGRSMLVLALVWWAWSAFVWAAYAEQADSATLRAILLLASVFILIAGLALPRAFQSEAPVFPVSYAVVRLLHLVLYADASRQGNAAWSAIAGFAVTVVIGMALLIIGSFTPGAARPALWAAAVAIDYAGPAWLTRDRLRQLQRVAVAHFAERYGLFVIICLGESIVAIGAGVRFLTHGAVGSALPAAPRLALCGGVAMYLLGNVGFRLRMVGDPGYHKLIAAGATMLLYALGAALPAWSTATLVAAVMAALCAAETLAGGALPDGTVT